MTTNDDTTATVNLHPFTEAGMGPAPFRFRYACSIPSPSLGEQNPTAYMNALAALPRDLVNGCGTCGHCGTALMNIFVVSNAEGKKYGVGCDCILKVGDMKVVPAAKAAKLKMEREKRRIRNEARREAKRLAWLAAKEAFETSPEGITAAKAKADAAEAERQRRAAIQAVTAPLAERLKDGQGGFRDSVAFDLAGGSYLRGRAAQIAADILAKQCGRTNSKAWAAELDRVWPLLTGEAPELVQTVLAAKPAPVTYDASLRTYWCEDRAAFYDKGRGCSNTWILTRHDIQGNQVGDADYTHARADAMRWLKTGSICESAEKGTKEH